MTGTSESLTRTFGEYGAWGREALRVALLASELGITIDREAIILSDVRDLQALRFRLSRHLVGSAFGSGDPDSAVGVTALGALLNRLGKAVQGLRGFCEGRCAL